MQLLPFFLEHPVSEFSSVGTDRCDRSADSSMPQCGDPLRAHEPFQLPGGSADTSLAYCKHIGFASSCARLVPLNSFCWDSNSTAGNRSRRINKKRGIFVEWVEHDRV